MSSTWNDPDREPASPEADLDALARLFRDHPPPEPSDLAWRMSLSRVEQGLARRSPGRARWPFLIGLIGTAAAMFGGVVLARALWPTPTVAGSRDAVAERVADDEPFAVVTLSEIQIHRMDPNDADRVVLGQPLLGTMEFAFPGDVDLVRMEPGPQVGRSPFLHSVAGGPMIIVARSDAADHDIEDDVEP